MSEPEGMTYADVKASPTVETPGAGAEIKGLQPAGAGPEPGPLVYDDGAKAVEPGYMDGIKDETEALIARVRAQVKNGSPAAQRAASIAITHYETACMWSVRARFL